MRLETKMKGEQEEEVLGDLQRKLNNCSLEPKKEVVKEIVEPNEDAEVVVKEVDAVTEALNDLSVQPKVSEDDDERIERGPYPKSHSTPRPIPYHQTQNKHLSGGSVIEVRPTGADSSNSFGSVNYLTQSKTFEQQPFSQSPYVDVKAGLQQDFSDDQIKEIVDELTSGSMMGQLILSGVEQELVLESILEYDVQPPASTTTLASASPAISILSPSLQSPTSSGYASGTSSPSHSPPRSDEPLVPESIQLVNSQKQPYRAILPRPSLESNIQREFYDYILGYGGDKEGNLVIFKRTEHIFFNLNNLEKLASPISGGDTMLMVFVANANSAKPFALKLGYNTMQEKVFRLSCIFNLAKRFNADLPAALEAKNDLQQSVLHLAARNCSEHPLVAAYIAEMLQKRNHNFNKNCTAQHCEMQGTGNLLHCLARMGDSHSEVLRQLLRLKSLQELIETTSIHQQSLLLTPLHVAITAHTENARQTLHTAQILIENGAKIGRNRCRHLNSALHFALSGTPSYEIVELVLSEKNSVEANVLDLEERHCLFNLAIGSRNLTEEKFFKLLRLLISKGATLKKVPNTVELFDELHKNFSEAAINKVRSLLFT